MSTETLAGGNKATSNSSGLIWDTVAASKSVSFKTNAVERININDSGVTLATPLAVSSGGTGVTSLSSTPAAGAIVLYDANKIITAENYLTGYATTAVTVNATATLVVGSKEVQRYTGSAGSTVIQKVVLPSTTTLSNGHTFTVINDSTSYVDVYNTAETLLYGRLDPKVDAGTQWAQFRFTGVAQSWTRHYPVTYDGSYNVAFNNMLQGFQAVTASTTPISLAIDDPYFTYVTGSAIQPFNLPDATTLKVGHRFAVLNGMASTSLTVRISTGLSTVLTQVALSDAQYMVVDNTVNTTAAWKYLYSLASSTGTVTSVAATVPAFLSVAGSPITTSGTLAISYSGTALPIANGGTGATSASSSVGATSYVSYDAAGEINANHFNTGSTSLSCSAGAISGTSGTISDLATAFITLNDTPGDARYAKEFIVVSGTNTYGTGDLSGLPVYTINLPTTASLAAGQKFIVSHVVTSGTITVTDSAGVFLANLKVNATALFMYTGAGWNIQRTFTRQTSAVVNNVVTIAQNVTATRLFHSSSGISSATTSPYLISADITTSFLRVTGSTASFVVQLPSLTTHTNVMPLGSEWTIWNECSQPITVMLGDGVTPVQVMALNDCMKFISRGVTDTTANWIRIAQYTGGGTAGAILQSNGSGTGTGCPTFKTISSLGIAFTDLTGTLAINKGGTGQTAIVTVPAASTIPAWDASSNLSSNNFLSGITTFAQSGTPVVLTIASTHIQQVTGTTGIQTITLPATYAAGTAFRILNSMSAAGGDVDVRSSGLNAIVTLLPGTSSLFLGHTANGTTAASWKVSYDNLDVSSVQNTTWTPTLFATTSSTYTSRDGNYSTTVSGTTPAVVSQWVKATAKIVMATYEGAATTNQLLTLTLPVQAGANAYTSISCWQGDIATPTNGFTTHTCPCTLTSGSSNASIVLNFVPAAADIWFISLDYLGSNLVS